MNITPEHQKQTLEIANREGMNEYTDWKERKSTRFSQRGLKVRISSALTLAEVTCHIQY